MTAGLGDCSLAFPRWIGARGSVRNSMTAARRGWLVPDDQPIGPDRAVVDRIVDGKTAVLLVGAQGTELHVPVDHLPEGAQDGTWVILDLAALIVGIDDDLTARRREQLEARMDHLRQERTGGRFSD